MRQKRNEERTVLFSSCDFTFGGRREEYQGVVEVLAVALEGKSWIVSEFELEVEAAGFEGVEENGVRRFEGEIVE